MRCLRELPDHLAARLAASVIASRWHSAHRTRQVSGGSRVVAGRCGCALVPARLGLHDSVRVRTLFCPIVSNPECECLFSAGIFSL